MSLVVTSADIRRCTPDQSITGLIAVPAPLIERPTAHSNTSARTVLFNIPLPSHPTS
ncbi:MAG TPA: hypothetical protein VF669_08390 [Tepidisphaeraceae bacterium]